MINTDKLKLLQINTVCNSGSTGRIAEQIALAASSTGYTCYTAYARNFHPTQTHPIHIGNSLDLILHGLSSRFFDNQGRCSKLATYKLIQQIEKIKPDIIHLHNIHGYYLNYPLLFDYLSTYSAPIVWTLHDCWPLTGHCAIFNVNCDKWKTGCHHCAMKRKYPASWFLDCSKRNYKLKLNKFNKPDNMTIVTVSDWLKEIVQQSFLQNKPIKRIYNGVDELIFYPRSEKEMQIVRQKYKLDHRMVLLAVANKWEESKGLTDYVCLSRILDMTKYQLVLVGLEQKQIASLPTNVRGIERTDNQSDLACLYSLADCVLSLSRSETFGLTIVEGFACGTPAIVYDSTATPELVIEQVGRIVPINDVEGVKRKIEELISIQDKNIMKDACSKYAKTHFSLLQMTDQYLDLYRELLAHQS